MASISRDPTDLVAQTLAAHQYPDGFMLFLGTLFAPIEDRDEPGSGFTHKLGDVVTIQSAWLGGLGAAMTLGLRSAGMLLVLIVLPLAVPALIFGAGAVDAVEQGLSASGHHSLLGALLIATALGVPWATAAALRISTE